MMGWNGLQQYRVTRRRLYSRNPDRRCAVRISHARKKVTVRSNSLFFFLFLLFLYIAPRVSYAHPFPWEQVVATSGGHSVLYGMDHGDTSHPVQSLMGWHIFRVDSLEQTYQFGRPDQKVIEDARAQLFNRRFDYEAAIHIRELVWAHDLAVETGLLKNAFD